MWHTSFVPPLIKKLWKWIGENVSFGHRQASNERTYEGIFQNYWYTSTPQMNFFSLSHFDHVTTTVRVLDTNLLAQLKKGTLVEIDTEVVPGCGYEIVKRVRVHDAQAS